MSWARVELVYRLGHDLWRGEVGTEEQGARGVFIIRSIKLVHSRSISFVAFDSIVIDITFDSNISHMTRYV